VTTLTFPSTLIPNQLEWALVSNTQRFESPLTRSVQTLEIPGARWAAKLTFRGLNRTQAATLIGFLAQLRGQAGRFYLWNHANPTPAGTALGTATTSSSIVQGANTVTTGGWTANQTSLLLPGDYIGLGGELKMVVTQAASDGSGNATLTFEPPLRNISGVASGTAIVVTKPTTVFMLKDDMQAQSVIQPGQVYDFALECSETFT
jgi:hypothetical protein